MDLSRIFIKNACPTSIGGQAVMEGVMMKGTDACAVAVRTPEGKIHIRTEPLPARPRIASIPLLRGVYVFVESLMQGMKTLMYSADVLQAYGDETVGTEEAEPDRLTRFLEAKLGARGAWNVMIGFSVALAILFTVLIFVIGPTALVGVLKKVTGNEILLNLAEGILRIALFIGYIAVISRMEDIKRLFRGELQRIWHAASTLRHQLPYVCHDHCPGIVLSARMARPGGQSYFAAAADTRDRRRFLRAAQVGRKEQRTPGQGAEHTGAAAAEADHGRAG